MRALGTALVLHAAAAVLCLGVTAAAKPEASIDAPSKPKPQAFPTDASSKPKPQASPTDAPSRPKPKSAPKGAPDAPAPKAAVDGPAARPLPDDASPSKNAPADPSPTPADDSTGSSELDSAPEEPGAAKTTPGVGPLGPGEGAGDRRIRPLERSEVPEPVQPATPKGAAPPPAGKPHKIGRAPAAPRATLPEGAVQPVPDKDARRQVAGGATVDDVSSGKNDPELRELSLAERVLFPKPLPGLHSGFSWDLPGPLEDGSADVDASGLPSGLSRSPRASRDPKQPDWVRSLTMPNLPTRLDARVVKYLGFYRDDPRGKSVLRIWAKKCGRLAPALRAELARAGLPTDLVWLSLIESGHNPTIVSSAGAAGLWQFVPESARMYGLTVDRWVDERLDPERSTEAAVRYLSDLRTRFGSWELAMAAYNMGHGGLLRAVRKFNNNDFWALSRYEAGLPWETTLYVPKILATAIAMANKKAFGIDDVEQDAPISFDTVAVGPNVDLGDVARAADVPPEDVRALNAAYLSFRTPPAAAASAKFPVRVPAGRGLVAEQRLAGASHALGTAYEPHTVRFGDNLDAIASDFGTTAKELAQQNHVGPDERLRAGSVILVPHASTGLAQPKDPDVVVVPGRRFDEQGRKRVFYRVVQGDRRDDVAMAFGVTPSELSLWNGLDSSAALQQGMALEIFVKDSADLSRVRSYGEHEVRILVAGTREFYEYFEQQNGRKRITVVAKKGDTLSSIGKRYGMSATMMERINRIPSSSVITPGDKLVVYSKGDTTGATVDRAEEFRELAAISAPLPNALPDLAARPPAAARAVTP
ncbi:MAG TPA: LysM peptidoglycan-binding domain-containing protein [Polyangiaceae bacterium]|jgi:membrane-bound lytic murein transglycosylase D|nr:LysM peptidoglycan-binding domain-containing protein [Polyangiaceae bacterium]